MSTSPYHNGKIERAFGGCLGVKGRRKAWYTAKRLGEPCAGEDPGIPEWGNPPGVKAQVLDTEYIGIQGERGELKHLSTRRKREYSPSSGERKGNSPNQADYGQAGVVGPTQANWKLAERHWKGLPETVKAR